MINPPKSHSYFFPGFPSLKEMPSNLKIFSLLCVGNYVVSGMGDGGVKVWTYDSSSGLCIYFLKKKPKKMIFD